MDFVNGGLAGAGASIATNPIDVIKTRLQLQGELRAKHEHIPQYRGTFHAMVVISRTDGVLALQGGLAPAMLLGFTMNACRLGLYHIAEYHDWTKSDEGNIDLKRAMFWSAAAGLASAIVANPMYIIKTRMQLDASVSIAVGKQYGYKGVADAFATIYRNEGLRGYFFGINATCARSAIGSAAQLTTYAEAKQTLIKHNSCTNSRPVLLSFCASALSGAAVAVAICPFDVTTVRLYNQGTTGTILYNGVFDCIYKTWKAEGLHGVYKGLWPLYLRVAPHTTISLVIWDFLNDILIK